MKSYSLFFKFTLCQVLYYLSYATVIGFAAAYLQSKGFSNTIIGIFFACSSIICILSQSVYGSFLDRNLQYSAKNFLVATCVTTIVCVTILILWPYPVVIFLCYVLLDTVMLLNASLFNSFAMEYINSGIALNYAFSRGIGSVFYAVASLFVGFLVVQFQLECIFPICLVIQILLFFSYLTLPLVTRQTNHMENKQTKEQIDSLPAFLLHNPNLLLFFLSLLLIYISYTSVNNFMINIVESIGGSGKELGISSAIAAIVELPAMALFLPFSKKITYQKMLTLSCSFFLIKVLCTTFSHNIFQLYLSQLLQFASYGLFVPASAYYINDILTDKDKTKGQSALGIFTFGLSGLIASMLSGTVLDYFDVHTLLILETILASLGLIGVFFTSKKLK